jgi:hypothetical protein
MMKSSDHTLIFICNECKREIFRSPKPGHENFCDGCDTHNTLVLSDKPYIHPLIKHMASGVGIKITDYYNIFPKEA